MSQNRRLRRRLLLPVLLALFLLCPLALYARVVAQDGVLMSTSTWAITLNQADPVRIGRLPYWVQPPDSGAYSNTILSVGELDLTLWHITR